MGVGTTPRGAQHEVRPGRPRDVRLDAAIQAAAVELVAERGYHGTSIAAVAERAGTTTPAVYRRWSSKAELVLAAVFRTEGDDVVADTDDLEADVRSMVRWTLQKVGHPAGRAALAGLLGEPPGTDAGVHEQLLGTWRRVGERLQRAVDAGQVRADLDPRARISALVGPAMGAAVMFGEQVVDETWVDALTSIAVDGLLVREDARR